GFPQSRARDRASMDACMRPGGTGGPMSRNLIRDAIHGAFNRSRFVQQVPILPDVWIRYVDLCDPERTPPDPNGLAPIDRRIDLLLTSDAGSEPGMIAKRLMDGLSTLGAVPALARVANNRTTVAADLTFSEMISVVVPMTRWWSDLPPQFRDF